jgi:hypothetical protein
MASMADPAETLHILKDFPAVPTETAGGSYYAEWLTDALADQGNQF